MQRHALTLGVDKENNISVSTQITFRKRDILFTAPVPLQLSGTAINIMKESEVHSMKKKTSLLY